MKLLEIPAAIDAAIDFFVDPETGEIKSEEETLAICEALEGERLGKIDWLAKRVVNSAAELEALQDHKPRLIRGVRTRMRPRDLPKPVPQRLLRNRQLIRRHRVPRNDKQNKS